MGPHRRTESEIGRPADLYRDRCGAPVPISLMRPNPRRSNPGASRGQRISFYAVRQGSLNPIIVIFVARFFSSSGPETSYFCRVSERTFYQEPVNEAGPSAARLL